MEEILKYVYNPYYAVPGVAILTTFMTKALNTFWENKIPDQVWSGIGSVGLSLVAVNYANPWQLIVIQVVASFSLSALSYKFLGTWFVERVFQALKSKLEKWFKKEEEHAGIGSSQKDSNS